MKIKRKIFLCLSLVLVTAIGLACSFNAIPPMGVIKVSALSIIQEIKSGDVNRALYRAFLKSLDKRAETLLGANIWRDNGWKGQITYSTPAGGLNTVYFEKECGQRAADRETEQSRPPNDGGSSANGGGGSSGGSGFVVIGGGCYGNCGGGKPTVKVGDLQQM
nr:hypothetical protein [Pseudoxanthomonas sp.]